MVDNRIRFAAVGLFIFILALGYFVFTQSTKRSSNFEIVQASPEPTTAAKPSPSPAAPLPATGVSSLPETGAPMVLVVTLAASAVAFGWGFRKFPH